MGQLWVWGFVLIYVMFINALTYLTFWMDKERAQMGLYRIPESTLHLLAILGGSPAALFARQKLRHKSRKQPFGVILVAITAFQVIAIIGWFGGMTGLLT